MNLLHEPMNLERAYQHLWALEKKRKRRRNIALWGSIALYLGVITWLIVELVEYR